jgi:hypothetical protein
MAKKAAKPLDTVKTEVNNQALIEDPEYAAFEGHWRRPVKNSIARSGNRAVPTQTYGDLAALLGSLVPDATMRKDYPDLKARSLKQKQAQQSGDTGPQARKPEELRNVKVTAWISAIKYEWGKTGDNDFHVILSSNATASADARFMTIEVSALPVVKAATKTNPHPGINKRSPDYETLRKARRQLVGLFSDHRLTETFYKPARPIKVTVTGSLHFDGDHTAGGASSPGPQGMKPKTVWEIHPVSSITPG